MSTPLIFGPTCDSTRYAISQDGWTRYAIAQDGCLYIVTPSASGLVWYWQEGICGLHWSADSEAEAIEAARRHDEEQRAALATLAKIGGDR